MKVTTKRNWRRIAAATAAGLLCEVAVALGRDREVMLSQTTGLQTPTGLIGLSKGDTLLIRLTGTYTACFTYNAEPVPAPKPKGGETEEAFETKPSQPEEVTFQIVHDGTAQGYRIKALRRATGPSWCTDIPEIDRTVNVQTYGWDLAMTGAFTIDNLTDPVFYLEPGTKDSKSGFFVRENRHARDSVRLGLGAMIHLFHSDPQALPFFRSRAVSWAPVSFGLAVDTGAQTKYFVGSSVRVGDKFFLTLGGVWGPQKRLPDAVAIDGFTENANALGSLPTRTTGRIFLALSYSFIDIGLNRFKGAFEEPAPAKPAEPKSEETGGTKPGPKKDPKTE